MSKFSGLAASLVGGWLILFASGCNNGRVVGCNDIDQFEGFDEAAKMACLTERLEDDFPGHASLGLAQIYLHRYVTSSSSEMDRESYKKYSELAKVEEFASESARADALAMIGYFDALMSMRSGRAVGRGDAWLDLVCPEGSQPARFNCHAKRLAYWVQQAEDGSQSENEALYLAYSGLYEKYREPIYRGVAISAQGFFDLPGAKADFDQMREAGTLESAIVFGYCDMLSRRSLSDAGVSEAIAEANCE